MSMGIVAQYSTGRVNKNTLYIKLKGGAVYKYCSELSDTGIQKLITAIKENSGEVRLKYWIKQK